MKPCREWSVRSRLSLLAATVMTLLCTGIAALIITIVHDDRMLETNRRNHDAIASAAGLLAHGQVPAVSTGYQIAAFQVIDPAGRVVSASANLQGRPPMAPSVPSLLVGGMETLCHMPDFPDTCMLVSAQRVPRPDGDWAIYVAAPAYPWYVNGRFLAGVVAGSALLIGVTAFGAWRIVGRSLKPVATIWAQLCKITSTDLGHRVPVPAPLDEIHDLACTVNQTLTMLEAALQRERRFTADASHDLRSPITAMRTQMEEALLHPADADWPATTAAMLDSLHRLQAIVTDLLTLSRLDAGASGPAAAVDLNELVACELDHRRPRKVTIARDLQPALVHGDRLQLVRLLTNLVDNAERHAASTVTVSLSTEGGQAVLAVSDDGSGVPADQRERIFERFARLEDARAKDAGGTGLGLPIARQIAEHHGGTLTVEDSGQGARFVARIPLYAARRPHPST
ncbi:ATP-binding protein [Nonomuraea fuscirosea]|uniref:sensor histidine kinase n=1 Tax=Nonomuraea fuscirosea TaxID=1291556 RepID=UPI002DD8B365|nr:ATP-binding protein [Nonomuraea fuscirosea]WSA58488.1 ATP-binding protein [Nonomuraea fuscirosea]